MSELSQLHDLAEICKKMDNPIEMSASSIIAISAECDDLCLQLESAKDVIATLMQHLPDSEHDIDESWQWCWDELSGQAQDKVKIARRYAEVFLEKVRNE